MVSTADVAAVDCAAVVWALVDAAVETSIVDALLAAANVAGEVVSPWELAGAVVAAAAELCADAAVLAACTVEDTTDTNVVDAWLSVVLDWTMVCAVVCAVDWAVVCAEVWAVL